MMRSQSARLVRVVTHNADRTRIINPLRFPIRGSLFFSTDCLPFHVNSYTKSPFCRSFSSFQVGVHVIPMGSPSDISGLKKLIEEGTVKPENIVAVLGKTEGNGCVNDFTRGYAVATLKNYLDSICGENIAKDIVFVMSGGTEGVLSPHMTVFTRNTTTREEKKAPSRLSLSVSVVHTRDFLPSEIGTLTMVDVVAKSVREAIFNGKIEPEDVHLVQIKCPLLVAQDSSGDDDVVTQDSYKSMAYSRAASALGVGVATGEIEFSSLKESSICSDFSLYSSVASTSAGVELQNCEIIVMGNSKSSMSEFAVCHDVMNHALDVKAIDRALESLPHKMEKSQIINAFVKAEADPTGKILGRRHTMMDDSDISHTRMARAVVGGAIASFLEEPMIYVSGGSEHQGPPGGGPIAIILKH